MDGPAFVKWIETMLIQNDISKETFYSESGISTANMTQWRAGDYKPSPRSVKKAEVFFEKYAKQKSPAPEGAELSEARMKLLAAIDGMSEDEVLAMVQMAEAAKRVRGGQK